MNKVGKAIDFVINNLLVLLLAALCIVVFLNVILRSVFTSMTWTVEISRLLFVYFIIISSIVALKEKIHFRVDLLVNHLPAKLQKICHLIGNLCVLFSLYVILIGSWKLVIINKYATLTVTGISYLYLYVVGIITALAMGIIILRDCIQLFTKKKTE
ncbi:MAG: TRAP transporter small permease [Bacillota bacterium]|jgi:TRAP-type C4-dicarboxylate transport system permease small subunit